ncbi:MAG: T9SS type A sorting domain-containing protein [Ignavibacteriae bacterium]|nr:T9SS type A sorting domain-containing protein [Ignavibacteriota bacterium]
MNSNIFKKLLALVIIFIFYSSNVFSFNPFDWKIQNYGYRFNSIIFPNLNTGFCCGLYGTIFKTTNSGDNWFLSTDTSDYQINFYNMDFIDVNTGFASGYNYSTLGYVIKTTNSGLNWQYYSFPRKIKAVDFTDGENGYAASVGGYIYKTTNGGSNWLLINTGLQADYYCVKFLNSNTGFLGGIFGSSKNKILKTTDGGNSWVKVLNGTYSNPSKNIVFINNSTGYSTVSNKIYKTTDQGNNWIYFDSCNAFIAKLIFTDSTNGFLCGSNLMMKTTNSGNNWIALPGYMLMNDIGFCNSQIGFATLSTSAMYNKVIKTIDGGLSWVEKLGGVNEGLNWMCGSEGNKYFMISDRRIITSTDGGINWVLPSVIESQTLNSIHFVTGSLGYAVGGNGYSSPFHYTLNGGLNWTETFGFGVGYTVITSKDSVAFLTGMYSYGYLKRKELNGSWTSVLEVPGIYLYDIQFPHKHHGYVGGDSGRIYKSTDFGFTWFRQSTPSVQSNYSLFFVDSLRGWAVGSIDYGNSGQILKTTNGGVNWISDLQVNTYLKCVRFSSYNTGWVVGAKGTIFYTTNCGNNWLRYPKMTSQELRYIYFKDANNGWIMGYNGLLLRTTNCGGLTGVENKNNTIADSYILKQNYPNPFNPSTNIRYQITNNKFVTLKVYDLLGKEVAVLVNENQKPGTYEVSFNGTMLPSGIYFYRLEAGDYSQTRKMILIK